MGVSVNVVRSLLSEALPEKGDRESGENFNARRASNTGSPQSEHSFAYLLARWGFESERGQYLALISLPSPPLRSLPTTEPARGTASRESFSNRGHCRPERR